MIKIYRLIDGTDIIADAEQHSTEFGFGLLFKNVVQLVPVTGPKGEQSFGIAPYPLYNSPKSDEGIFIKNEHILFSLSVPADILQYYNQIFNKVITPKSSIII